jgi:hypothetical protein
MEFEYSKHWEEQKETRKEITDDVIEYCIQNSTIIKDKKWENALNAITRIPPSGKLLKVVYRRKGNIIKVITAFWLD